MGPEDQNTGNLGNVVFSLLIGLKRKAFVSAFPFGISLLLLTVTIDGFDQFL